MQSNVKWDFDPTHSEVIFKVKHMVFTTITGRFDTFNAVLTNNSEDFTNAKLNFTAQIDSINTNNKDRDNHLQAEDFFNAEKFPSINFDSTVISKTEQDSYQVLGQLTMLDTTLPITLSANVSELMVDPWGNKKLAISLKGQINRKDFGLSYHAVLENGGLLIGDNIVLETEVQFVQIQN